MVDVRLVPDERRAHLEDVAVRSGQPRQRSAGHERLEQPPRGRAVDDVDAGHEAHGAYVAQHVRRTGQAAQPVGEVRAGDEGLLREASVLEHVEDRVARGGCGGGRGERREVLPAPGEPVDHLAPRDHGADRVAGAHRLAEGDEVGHDAGLREPPEPGPGAAVADLHLVGEVERALGVRTVAQPLDVRRRRVVHALAGEAGVGQQQRRPVAAGRHLLPRGADHRGRRVRRQVAAGDRRAERADRLGPVARRPLVGAEVGHPSGGAVVAVLDDQRAAAAGPLGGEPPGELVGLGAGRREEDGVEPVGHGRDDPLGQLDDLGVEVARVGVEPTKLPPDPEGDRRVGVADDGDVVVGVEVATTVGGGQPGALAADDLQRLVVEERRDGAAHRGGAPAHPRRRRLRPPGCRRAGATSVPARSVTAAPARSSYARWRRRTA